MLYTLELGGSGFLLGFAFFAVWSWSFLACHCKLFELFWPVLSITENCLSGPKLICFNIGGFPIISENFKAPLIVPVGDARTTFECDLLIKESYATFVFARTLSPLITRLVQSFSGLDMMSNPCFVPFVMFPPVLCPVLCNCG